ncbi:MAG TPA: RIP metalloprotease RseP [Rhizomicrobium sp.]|jgi:regulator of sigma E protease|nr:RIP metalloprotease RseP [Rhizomicrobium sp.]
MHIFGFLSWIWPFLLLITPIVFFHELGHFSVARLFGVRIEMFSIGFGPEIFGWTDKKGTRWKISWLPLGGYVKFFGDMDASSKPDQEKIDRASPADSAVMFQKKPLYQRALIVAAGPFANFVLAVVVFAGLFMAMGNAITPAVVDKVTPGSPAAAAGILPGDSIRAIDGKPVTGFDDVLKMVTLDTGDPLAITLQRKTASLVVHATPRLTAVKDRFGNKYNQALLGIQVLNPKNPQIIYPGPIQAVGQAFGQVGYIVKTVLNYRMQLMRGQADASQLAGPVGIVKMSHDIASIGLIALVSLAALISVSIGLVNLFPIPVLDGGHLLYYACEAVLGRPLSAKAQDIGFRLGLAFMLGLMIFATWNDLVRLNLF